MSKFVKAYRLPRSPYSIYLYGVCVTRKLSGFKTAYYDILLKQYKRRKHARKFAKR